MIENTMVLNKDNKQEIEELKDTTLYISKATYGNFEYSFNPPICIEVEYDDKRGWYHLICEDFGIDHSGKDLKESIKYVLSDIFGFEKEGFILPTKMFDVDNGDGTFA